MANLAASAVTVNAFYPGLDHTSKRYVFAELTLVLTAQGTATNKIQASVLKLGYTKLVGCTSAIVSDNSAVLPASPSADGTLLLIGGGASNAPQDITGTISLTVWGQTY